MSAGVRTLSWALWVAIGAALGTLADSGCHPDCPPGPTPPEPGHYIVTSADPTLLLGAPVEVRLRGEPGRGVAEFELVYPDGEAEILVEYHYYY